LWRKRYLRGGALGDGEGGGSGDENRKKVVRIKSIAVKFAVIVIG